MASPARTFLLQQQQQVRRRRPNGPHSDPGRAWDDVDLGSTRSCSRPSSAESSTRPRAAGLLPIGSPGPDGLTTSRGVREAGAWSSGWHWVLQLAAAGACSAAGERTSDSGSAGLRGLLLAPGMALASRTARRLFQDVAWLSLAVLGEPMQAPAPSVVLLHAQLDPPVPAEPRTDLRVLCATFRDAFAPRLSSALRV